MQEELGALGKKAWDEVDQLNTHFKFDLDWDAIKNLEANGMWRTYCMRDPSSNKMIGFLAVVIQSLLHSKGTYHAITDCAYVEPEYRGGFSKLLSLCEQDLRDEGVKMFTFTLKSWDLRGDFLENKGFTHYENIYQKVIK